MSELSFIKDQLNQILNTQGKIFDKIDEIKEDFSKQKIICENRITTIETTSKAESKINAKIYGTIFGIASTFIVLFIKWILTKIPGITS